MQSPNENLYKAKHLVRKHLRSYKWAGRGMISILISQTNFVLELLISLAVLIAAIYFKVTKEDAVILAFAITLVLTAEALNSALEALSDAITTEKHQDIRYAKDVGAGAVLLSAIGAAVIGLVVFVPYIADMSIFN